MTKKNFKTGLSSLLGNEASETKRASTKKDTKKGEARATFLVVEETMEIVRNIAYWERLKIKNILNEALLDYIAKHESTKGKIKARP